MTTIPYSSLPLAWASWTATRVLVVVDWDSLNTIPTHPTKSALAINWD